MCGMREGEAKGTPAQLWLRGEGEANAAAWELRALCASQLEINPFPAAGW